MKLTLKNSPLVAVAALAITGHANAAAICGPARVDVGDPGRNGVVSTYVAHDPNGTWTIKHTLANGQLIDRSLQYVITDHTGPNAIQWRGTLMRNPSMTMVGEAMKLTATGQPTYDEWLYQNGQVIMHSMALCQFDNAQVTQPSVSAPAVPPTPVAAPAPARVVAPAPAAAPVPIVASPALAGEDSIGIVNAGNEVLAQLAVGSQPVVMVVNTGANVMSITDSVAKSLVARGEAEWTSDVTIAIADGSRVKEGRVVIHEVRIGSHVLSAITAGIVPDSAPMLLPFPVLNRVGRFTIDTTANKLIFDQPLFDQPPKAVAPTAAVALPAAAAPPPIAAVSAPPPAEPEPEVPARPKPRPTQVDPAPVAGGNSESRYLTIVYGMIKSKLHEAPELHLEMATHHGVVDLYVDEGGNLVGRKLVSSSGSSNLDAAVMAAIAEAAPYPAPPNWRAHSLNYNFGKIPSAAATAPAVGPAQLHKQTDAIPSGLF